MNLTLRILLFSLLCSLPAWILLWRLFNDDLGANPVEFLQHDTGDWTIYFLLLSLSITPIQKYVKPNWNRWIMPMHLTRRVLGLSAFCYALLHLTTYFVFDMELSLLASLEDIIERPFILIGMLSLLMLIPLAITSTAGWQKRLKSRWQKLHKATYFLTFLGILHYALLVKADLWQPILYMSLFTILMLFRIKKT